jgi:hypothetical protein
MDWLRLSVAETPLPLVIVVPGADESTIRVELTW